jgi:hypothetical protein
MSLAIVGVDPGFTIGAGVLLPDKSDPEAWETGDLLDVVREINLCRIAYGNVSVVVEAYNSSGHATREAKHCFGQVGFFQYWCRLESIKLTIAQPGARIPNVEKAKEMMQRASIPTTRDALAALAHALSHREKLEKKA